MPDESRTEGSSASLAESLGSMQQSPEIAVANRPARNKKALDRLIETIGFASAKSALEQLIIPASYEAAVNDLVYSAEWKAAI
jgi:hypothetical protein